MNPRDAAYDAGRFDGRAACAAWKQIEVHAEADYLRVEAERDGCADMFGKYRAAYGEGYDCGWAGQEAGLV
jgi:hypothetical protein